MKFLLASVLLILSLLSFSQDEKTIENKLRRSFERINYWAFEGRGIENSYDSLNKANVEFRKLLLKITSSNPKSIEFKFKGLDSIGLEIVTSSDNNLRIFSWNTGLGGTMHHVNNLFQYRIDNKVYAELNNKNIEEGSGGSYFNDIMTVSSSNATYYLVATRSVLSSAYRFHEVEVYSLQNKKINFDAKGIKTKSGIKHSVSYEVDHSSSVNDGPRNINTAIVFDTTKKEFSFPVILENGKITNKKMIYRFTGNYFERVQ